MQTINRSVFRDLSCTRTTLSANTTRLAARQLVSNLAIAIGFSSVVVFIAPTLAITQDSATQDSAAQSGLEYSRWSGGINVPDPVAITFDTHGRAYVTQTQRRKSQDLDIRANSDWIPFDVGLQTVEQKRAFYHWALAPHRNQERNRQRVEDLNHDGSHDYRDLMMISERIYRIADQDGDGTADAINLFAEGFQSEVTGIAAGVLWFDGAVYSTIAPDVWMLRDRDDDGQADERSVVATGFGIHIAYAGHDMHGLTIGPDRKIYWTIGDKGISVRSIEGKRFHFPNQGGVLRCDPDGSNLEVFAHGLRNVQEIAFDQFGNLFGVDNDADMPQERERFVSIVRGMDAGWRCNYQYRGERYNPWTRERLWVPHFEDQAAYIVPPISHSIDGPAGFAFNPGTALSERWTDYFFLTGAPDGQQIAFQVETDGDSFRMINEETIGSGKPIVGISFGPDGALYGVDWGGGYPLTGTGAIWQIDASPDSRQRHREQVEDWLADGTLDLTDEELVSRLAHADQRIRLASQFELVDRNRRDLLIDVAAGHDDLLSRVHAIWGLGQLARVGDEHAIETVTQLLTDEVDQIRIQSARVLADATTCDSMQLIPNIDDQNPHVVIQTLLALSCHPDEAAVEPIIQRSSQLPIEQTYLRHAIAMALANCASDASLAKLHLHASKQTRICAILALRHRRSDQVALFLNDFDEAVATEAARAIYDDFSIPTAMTDLAAQLNQTPHRSEALIRRIIGANLRLGEHSHSRAVAQFAQSSEVSSALQLAAIEAMVNWNQPNVLDKVTGRHRPTGTERRQMDEAIVRESLLTISVSGLVESRSAAIDALSSFGWQPSADSLLAIISENKEPGLVIAALNGLENSANEFSRAIDLALSHQNSRVRSYALQLLVENDQARAIEFALTVLNTDEDTDVKQSAIRVLGFAATDVSRLQLTSLLDAIIQKELPQSLWLEVLEAVETLDGSPELETQLARFRELQQLESEQDVAALFSECIDGGDAERGRAIFRTNLTVQCARCHQVGSEGSNVGPELTNIATKRDALHLLRAIVSPNSDIDGEYQSVSVLMFSGKVIQGLLVEELDDSITLGLSDGTRTTLSKEDIDDRIDQGTSIMPDMTTDLTRAQIRDLVAYLKTLR